MKQHYVTQSSGVTRALEIIPTATVWLIITAPVWGALLVPELLGFALVLFSIYWLWKSLQFAAGVGIGTASCNHDWARDYCDDDPRR